MCIRDSIVSERERGTIESMVLAPVRPADLVWGRYLRVALPWMRFMLWMLPLYLVLSSSELFTAGVAGQDDTAPGLWALFALGPRGISLGLLAEPPFRWGPTGPTALSVALCLVRWLRDAWNIMLVAALGMHISARARSTLRGLLLAFLIVPLTMAVVFCIPEVLGFIAANFLQVLHEEGARIGVNVLYPCFALLGVVAEVLVARRALRLVAWNFAPFAVGEKAESWWKAFEG